MPGASSVRAFGVAQRFLDSRACVLAALMAATLLLHGEALDRWWCCDDTQILKQAVGHSPYEYFFVPSVWRALSANNLTPWLTLSFDIDHALFGFDPAGYYAHNLVTIALCAWLLYLVLRAWTGGAHALAAAALFLSGAPVAAASEQLMVRHYVEGLLFYLLAMWCVTKAVQSGRMRYAVLAVPAFAAAASAKEIYLPLALLPFVLPFGGWRRRLAAAWPLLVVVGLYALWRRYMLGAFVGGYTPPEAMIGATWRAAIEQFAQVPALLWSAPGVALAATAFAGVAGLARSVRAGAPAWRFAWLVFLAPLLVLPLLPLINFPGLGAGSHRYFIAVWAALAAVFSVAAHAATAGKPARLLALPLFAAVILPAWSASARMHADMARTHAEYRAQGMAIATMDDSVVVMASPAVSTWFNTGLSDLRPAMGASSPPPRVVVDESDLANAGLGSRRALRYEAGLRAMADVTPQVEEAMAKWRERLRPVPLSVDLEYDPGSQALSWRLGPAQAGSYAFLGQDGRVQLPAKGSLRGGKPTFGCFRIRYDAPEGWIAYSPRLALPHTDGVARLSWRGTGDMFRSDEPEC